MKVDFYYSAPIAFLKADESFIIVSTEYIDFADIFFLNFAVKFPKYTRINKHLIDLVEG